MFEIKGKFTTAKVMIDEIDETCMNQIVSFLNHPAFTEPVAIMPDTHAGAGAVIGFTMPLGEKLVPSTIGVDISCGVLGYQFSSEIWGQFDSLEVVDTKIRQVVPFGFAINETDPLNMEKDFPWDKINVTNLSFCRRYNEVFSENMKPTHYDYEWFLKKCDEIKISPTRAIRSLGTLGGGNHYIEFGRDQDQSIWLTIHSGSRQFGKCICDYWQSKPRLNQKTDIKEIFSKRLQEIKKTYISKTQRQQIPQAIKKLKTELGMNNKVKNTLDYLIKEDKQGYLSDMVFTEMYARINRHIIANKIINVLFPKNYKTALKISSIETIHNYISLEDFIIRKGAVSARKGEKILIPFNMEDGVLICQGKGNPEWNYSAPHGAGRIFSRNAAKSQLDITIVKERMSAKKIYSSAIPIDEVKEAYKDPQIIENSIKPAVEIIGRIKPFLNLKAL